MARKPKAAPTEAAPYQAPMPADAPAEAKLAGQGADKSSDDVDQTELERYKAWFRADRDHSADWRKEAKEDFEFLSGDQWSQGDKDKMKEQFRPVITFNRTNPIINTISGIEISNRQEVKFYPRQMGNAQADEVLTNAVEWYRDLSNADDEDSDMFLDVVVSGLGGTETTLDFDTDKEGTPSVNCINPLELYWDHSSRKKNFTDASRRWRVRDIPLSKLQAMFPKADPTDFDANWASAGEDDDKTIDRERARLYADEGNQAFARDETMATIVHLQHKEQVTVYDVKDLMSGKTTTVPEAQIDALKQRYEDLRKIVAPGVQPPMWTFTDRKTYQIVTCIIGSKILLSTPALCPEDFSFQFVTGFLDRNTGLPYGMMKIMKDPQRWANKWMSQAMHILNTNAKGGVMMEEDAVENIADFERTWPRNDKVTTVAPGALSGPNAKIQPKQQPSMDGSFFNMMQFAINSVPQVTGVSVELQGLRAADQPASLEQMRKQSGIDQLAPLFDNLKRYRRDQGKVMLYIIQKVIPKIDQAQGNEPRLVRVVGQDGAQYVPLALAADVKYDIIVDDQVNTAEQKTQIWQMMLPFIQSMPPQVLLAMLDYSPFPPSVVQKVRDAAKQAMAPDPQAQQVQQAQTQLALQDAKAGIDVKNSTVQKNQAEAARTASEIGQQPPAAAPAPQPSPIDNMVKWAQINKDNSMAEKNRSDAMNTRVQMVSAAPGAPQYEQ